MIVNRSGLERLERDLTLAIIFEAHAIEIVLAEVHRQFRAPVAGIARIFDEPALLERLHLIRPGAERRIEGGGGEVTPLPPRRRKHRHADDDQMRVSAASLNKAHMDDVATLAFSLLHLSQKLGVDRVALLLQDIQREGDVGSRHFRAVEEARLGAQPEAVVELVAGDPNRLRQQAIDRVGFVAVGGHQRVEGRRHAGRAVAFPGVDIERVEGVEVLVAARSGDLKRQEAAGRRAGVDIGEMREVWRQREIAERRQAMRLDEILGKGGERAKSERRQRPAGAGLQRRPAGQAHGHGIVRLVAGYPAGFIRLRAIR